MACPTCGHMPPVSLGCCIHCVDGNEPEAIAINGRHAGPTIDLKTGAPCLACNGEGLCADPYCVTERARESGEYDQDGYCPHCKQLWEEGAPVMAWGPESPLEDWLVVDGPNLDYLGRWGFDVLNRQGCTTLGRAADYLWVDFRKFTRVGRKTVAAVRASLERAGCEIPPKHAQPDGNTPLGHGWAPTTTPTTMRGFLRAAADPTNKGEWAQPIMGPRQPIDLCPGCDGDGCCRACIDDPPRDCSACGNTRFCSVPGCIVAADAIREADRDAAEELLMGQATDDRIPGDLLMIPVGRMHLAEVTALAAAARAALEGDIWIPRTDESVRRLHHAMGVLMEAVEGAKDALAKQVAGGSS